MYIRRPVRLLNVLCTFNLSLVSAGRLRTAPLAIIYYFATIQCAKFLIEPKESLLIMRDLLSLNGKITSAP